MHSEHTQSFDFKLNSKIKFGVNSCFELPKIIAEMGFNKIGLIVDQGVSTHETITKLEQDLAQKIAFKFTNKIAEPSFEQVDQTVDQFRKHQIDCLIAFGGGSTLDLAKGISVLLTNQGPAINYRGYGLIKNQGISFIAVPTTAGSGSEVTPNASYVDTKEMRKLGINTDKYLPILTILDPVLTLSCPRSVTSSSGLDALVHSMEAFTALSATPVARMFAKEAFKLVFNSLRTVVNEPSNLEYRGKMLLGAYFAGIALINSASGPAGVLSYPLGVHYKVPHGIAGAVFLAPVVRFNIERGYEAYSQLYDLIEDADNDMTTKEKNWGFLTRLEQLCLDLAVPTSLSEFGVKEADLSKLAVESYTNRTKSAEQNPIPVKAKELEIIIRMVA